MKVLAIHPGHNSTAALVVDGELVAAISQEKADNIKNSAAFPSDASQWCLDTAGLAPRDIDKVVIAGEEVMPQACYAYLFNKNQEQESSDWKIELAKSLERGPVGRAVPWVFQALRSTRRQQFIAAGKAELKSSMAAIGLPSDNLIHVEHHECHARAAFHALDESDGKEPALMLTLDGSGDAISGTVTTWRPGEGWKRIATVPMEASLGGYYSNTTRFLGMKILEHEYKVMGLAPYCKSYYLETYKKLFEPVVWQDPDNPLTFRSSVNAMTFYDYLAQHAVGERFDNIAGAVQHLMEERVTEWARAAISQTGIRRVFTGGGVFMNVKLNKCLQEMPEIESIHFMPSCGDESNPIGAAYAVSAAAGVQPKPIKNIYLGIEYSRDELSRFIDEQRLAETYSIEEPADINERVADLLASGEIVARFAGRCEWGARSLGNRAILGHPSHMESFYTVNDQIKSRDFWMPFAPSMLDYRAAEYLEGYNPERARAPYMITAFQATPKGVQDLRAALHQGDHTLRPQVVTQDGNPDYYRLLQSFEKRTGVGGVLNTSFNLHGYPLVATPEQAVFTLERSGLRNLALGPFLVSKRPA
ncbi:carbamoyltransferase C-terminal domain-containing protein [Caenispirillum salinarum]|uniref:carbamoyltransferase C-terminal domain-containing protein n=1 Tax=Caenispirillum salinarum TaxID=859058 RepID=UPI00384C51B0